MAEEKLRKQETKMELAKGKTYLINHARKGTFIMKVEIMYDGFIGGTIVGGKTSAMLDYNVKHKGEKITFRKSFINSVIEQPGV